MAVEGDESRGSVCIAAYADVLSRSLTVTERSCENVKRARLPRPTVAFSTLRSRVGNQRGLYQAILGIHPDYSRYACIFDLRLNFTLRLTGAAGTRRQTCERVVTVDSDVLALDCREKLSSFPCPTLPRQPCDADCGPLRVQMKQRPGQIQRLSPSQRSQKLHVTWEFPDHRLGGRAVAEYRVRTAAADLADDASLRREWDVRFHTVPVSAAPTVILDLPSNSPDGNYTAQVTPTPKHH